MAKLARFPGLKERYRVAGEGGVLGVGRCPYSLYKEILVTGHPDTRADTPVNLQTFVGEHKHQHIMYYETCRYIFCPLCVVHHIMPLLM